MTFRAGRIFPTPLGTALVKAYAEVGVSVYKLGARQKLEEDLAEIIKGKKSKQHVYDLHLKHFRKKFKIVSEQSSQFRQVFRKHFQKEKKNSDYVVASENIKEEPKVKKQPKIFERTCFMTCRECKRSKLKIKQQLESGSLFIACTGWPHCRTTMQLPHALTSVVMLEELCQ